MENAGWNEASPSSGVASSRGGSPVSPSAEPRAVTQEFLESLLGDRASRRLIRTNPRLLLRSAGCSFRPVPVTATAPTSVYRP